MGNLEFGFGMSRLFVWGAVWCDVSTRILVCCLGLVKRILVWFRGLVWTLRS